MKLRSNLVIVFAVTYLCLLGVLYISTTTVLLEGYQEIEKMREYAGISLEIVARAARG